MKTYWWKGSDYPNLGDELTPIILSRLFEVSPEHSAIREADLAATGSLLGWLWGEKRVGPERKPLHVIGAGFMSADVVIEELSFLHIHSVRGYLSKNKLGRLDRPEISIGDPGLLTSEIVNISSTPARKKYQYGVILHHRHSGSEEVKARFEHLPVKFLDIRTDDIDGFSSRMLECEVIVSQSLHGLVLADSLGIPNVWLELGPIHSGGGFKFYDYFSSVGRPFYLKISSVPRASSVIDKQIYEPDSKRIRVLQNGIYRAFDSALKGIREG